MTSRSKGRKWLVRILVVLLVLSALCWGIYYMLPNEKKRQLFETLGIENSDFVASGELETFISVRNVTSRKALIGDDWIIKGQVFNTHQSRAVKAYTLMFNFSDGVVTIDYQGTISADNRLGNHFKERISGHGNAEFLSIDVIDAK